VLGHLWAPFLLFRVFLGSDFKKLSPVESLFVFRNFLRRLAGARGLDELVSGFDCGRTLALFIALKAGSHFCGIEIFDDWIII
jgi:hypothetical protein